MPGILEVQNLTVEVDNKTILKNISFSIEKGETVVIFGPNGAGKSSLLYALLGFPNYRVKEGKVIFKNQDVTSFPVNERVKLGLGVSFQNPPRLRGVKLLDMLKLVGEGQNSDYFALAQNLKMSSFLSRDVNRGFSGGEVKRSEILQLLVQQPDLALLDEPDSGVDLENIELVGKEIEELIKNRSALLITHHGHILNYITADRALVLYEGRLACQGRPEKILSEIKEKGYSGCVECPECQKNLRGN